MDESIIYNIFLFLIIPFLMTLIFADRKSRTIFGFIIIGVSVCLLASELNSMLLEVTGFDFEYYSTTISPMVEELLKGLPVFFTVFFIMDNPEPRKCVSYGLAIGVSFAMFENIVLYFQNGENQSLLWSFARGIGAGLMHAICTGAFAFAICFVKNYKKGYFFGLFGFLSTAMIYHGTFNHLVQHEATKYYGVLLPVVTVLLFIPLQFTYYKKDKAE